MSGRATHATSIAARAATLIVTLALTAGAARAQARLEPERQRAAIARLTDMVGEWEGEGWIAQGERRETFRGGERVQLKLDGLAILVEGRFTTRRSGSDQDVPIHTTLGVISFDPRTDRYRFDTWLASGASGEQELELVDGGWRWFLRSPAGTIRYTTTFAGGEWAEVGEMQEGEGAPWRQFFEMQLKRVAGGGG